MVKSYTFWATYFFAVASLSHRAEPVSQILWPGFRLYRYTREVNDLHKVLTMEVCVVSETAYRSP